MENDSKEGPEETHDPSSTTLVHAEESDLKVDKEKVEDVSEERKNSEEDVKVHESHEKPHESHEHLKDSEEGHRDKDEESHEHHEGHHEEHHDKEGHHKEHHDKEGHREEHHDKEGHHEEHHDKEGHHEKESHPAGHTEKKEHLGEIEHHNIEEHHGEHHEKIERHGEHHEKAAHAAVHLKEEDSKEHHGKTESHEEHHEKKVDPVDPGAHVPAPEHQEKTESHEEHDEKKVDPADSGADVPAVEHHQEVHSSHAPEVGHEEVHPSPEEEKYNATHESAHKDPEHIHESTEKHEAFTAAIHPVEIDDQTKVQVHEPHEETKVHIGEVNKSHEEVSKAETQPVVEVEDVDEGADMPEEGVDQSEKRLFRDSLEDTKLEAAPVEGHEHKQEKEEHRHEAGEHVQAKEEHKHEETRETQKGPLLSQGISKEEAKNAHAPAEEKKSIESTPNRESGATNLDAIPNPLTAKPNPLDSKLIAEPTLSEKANITNKNKPISTQEEYKERQNQDTLPPKKESDDRSGRNMCGNCVIS